MKTLWERRRPSPAAVIAAVALFVALSSSGAYGAATNFLLNAGNTGNKTTSLNASAVAGAGLQLTNTNTATGSTALGLTVGKGDAPFTVNSGTKVKQLNADKLDGIDSGGFLQGHGSSYTNALSLTASGTSFTDNMLPDLATVTLDCVTSNAMDIVVHPAVAQENIFYISPNASGQETSIWCPISPPDSLGIPVEQQSGFVEVSVQGDVNGVQTVGTLSIGAGYRSDTNDCTFQIQGITTHA